MRFTKFVHLFEINNKITAIYHSITLKSIYTSVAKEKLHQLYNSNTETEIKSLFECDDEQSTKMYTDLVSKKMIVDDNYDEYSKIQQIYFSNTSQLHINTLYLMLTNECNLRCKYCVVKNNEKKASKQKSMSSSQIKEYIDYFYKYRDKKSKEYNITIYGGEPLLYPDKVRYIINYTKNKFEGIKKTNIILLTNGLLLNTELIDFIKKYDVNLVISLDGNKIDTDENRLDHKGVGTYNRIINRISALNEKNVRFAISCTIGIGNENRTSEIFDHIVSATDCKDIGINYIMDTENYDRTSINYAKKVTEGLINIHKNYRNTNIYEDRISRKIKAFSDKHPMLKDCTGCGKQMVFTADNKIGPCQSFATEELYFKYFEPDNDLTETDLIEWNTRTPFNIKECYDCFALGFCGGGCPYRAFKNKGSIYEIDEIFCVHSKMLLEHFIKFSFNETVISS